MAGFGPAMGMAWVWAWVLGVVQSLDGIVKTLLSMCRCCTGANALTKL